MSRIFEQDHWGLINILRAADRRIGLRRLPELKCKIGNKAALKVIEERLALKVNRFTSTNTKKDDKK